MILLSQVLVPIASSRAHDLVFPSDLYYSFVIITLTGKAVLFILILEIYYIYYIII